MSIVLSEESPPRGGNATFPAASARGTSSNPWRLTPAQAECMDLYLKLGHLKLVAAAKGVSLQAVHPMFARAKDRMQLRDPALRYDIHFLVAWHDWRRTTLS